MKIKFLGIHNSESRDTRLTSLIIDDILALDAGSLATELSFKEQASIKAIFLSHGHYDHIKDIPAFAFNNMERKTPIYGISETLKLLPKHFFNGVIYPELTHNSSFLGKQTLELRALEPYHTYSIEGYSILIVPLNHCSGSAGFEIIGEDGKSIFYACDTGPCLSDLSHSIHPDLLIIDLTFPDKLEKAANSAGHLCPQLLKRELDAFLKVKGYLPNIFPIHLSPMYESEIRQELNEIADQLKFNLCSLTKDKELVL